MTQKTFFSFDLVKIIPCNKRIHNHPDSSVFIYVHCFCRLQFYSNNPPIIVLIL